MRAGRLFFAVLSLVAMGSPAARGVEGPDQDKVDRAIGRGLDFLKKQQGESGSWTYSYNHDHELGITALAGLALLENGVASNDPAIVKAEAVVKEVAVSSDQTYDLTLAILFLARVQKGTIGPNDALIRRLAERLDAGNHDGMWTYKVPVRTTTRTERQTRQGSRKRGRFLAREGDNSNTQFALLGIWAAGRHGFDPNDALEAIDEHFRGSQESQGHWGYMPGDKPGDAMTCAGLMALAITAARPALAERQTARARGAALAADPKFGRALAAVALDARKIGSETDIYYLWSLERVCVALGLRDLDGLDWYATGARELLRRQQTPGNWPDEHWGKLPNTCLSLLFLRKANLAFELDRVLKLPSQERAKSPEPVETKGLEIADSASPGDASVVVTGASDAKFPEVAVDFEVKRPDGSFLIDARASDFHVTEDGAPVSILRFEAPTGREARPITVVLVVDRSRSMEEEDRIGMLKRAVATFLKGLPRGSRVAVVAFGSDVETICPFTGDFAKVQQAVDRLTPDGATRYYDAVAEALAMIGREPGRRAVLALTDGEDTFSKPENTVETLIASARREGLPVHTLGLGSDDEIESASLRHLAQASRGQYYPARQADQLREIYEQIAARLRASYSLVYLSDRKIPDGTLRPVRIAYRASKQAGETAVFVPGMVVPAAGWPRLFLTLISCLFLTAILTARRRRVSASG